MFNRIKLRLNEMKTINQLIPGADAQANALGEETAGAEHYVLAALELEEGSAKRVFAALNINAENYRDAINKQYDQALDAVGIDAETVSIEPVTSKKLLPVSHPSGRQLMKSLHALKKNDKDRPLLGAHVLAVAAEIKHGVVARAFKELNIEPSDLKNAIQHELKAHQ